MIFVSVDPKRDTPARLKEYVEFFLDDQMIGPDSPLAEYGLVPAPDAERQEQRDAFGAGKVM